jgi:hypothetical protein
MNILAELTSPDADLGDARLPAIEQGVMEKWAAEEGAN